MTSKTGKSVAFTKEVLRILNGKRQKMMVSVGKGTLLARDIKNNCIVWGGTIEKC